MLAALDFFGNRSRVFLDPTIERCMIQIYAVFGHDLFEVAIRNGEANVEIHGIQDHGFRVLCVFEADRLFNPDVVAGECEAWIDAPGDAIEIRKIATLPFPFSKVVSTVNRTSMGVFLAKNYCRIRKSCW